MKGARARLSNLDESRFYFPIRKSLWRHKQRLGDILIPMIHDIRSATSHTIVQNATIKPLKRKCVRTFVLTSRLPIPTFSHILSIFFVRLSLSLFLYFYFYSLFNHQKLPMSSQEPAAGSRVLRSRRRDTTKTVAHQAENQSSTKAAKRKTISDSETEPGMFKSSVQSIDEYNIDQTC